MSSVSIVLRKDKVNGKGEMPIHFRIIKNRKVSNISSTVYVSEDNWDDKNKRVKSKHKNSARMNSIISNKFTELQDKVFEFDTLNKSATLTQLKESMFGKKPEDFFEFADGIVLNYKADGKISTFITHSGTLNTLKGYVNDKRIAFQDITPEFLEKYERFLKLDRKIKTNTIHKHFKFIRKIFNDALRLEKIEYSQNPFLKFKLKLEKTSREYLTEAELLEIEKVDTMPGERMDLHKKMFIFASYCGIRISDVLKLKWNNYTGSHIDIIMHKTKQQISIKLPNKAIDIVNEFKKTDSNLNHFIFPMLDNTLNLDDPQESYSAISSATAYINKNLKLIAAKAEIDKPLSFHISRHTFATRALTKGMSIDKVSKILGHAQIRETQIYAKIVNTELDKAMDIFND